MGKRITPLMNRRESMKSIGTFCWYASYLSALIILAASASLISAQTPEPPVSLTTAGPVLLNPGDLINVQVFSTPELSGTGRLDENGFVALPLGPKVKLAGLTSEEAARFIEQRLKTDQIMLDPHVTVSVTSYATQGVTVLGEVTRPGAYPLFGEHSLYDALALAGGPSANQGSQITIAHASDPTHPVQIDVQSANYSPLQKTTPIYSGDTIIVSKASIIYVVGDVARAGAYPIVNGKPLSLLNLLSLTSGLNVTAAGSHASIIRQVGDRVDTIPVDLDAVLKRKQPNIAMQAEDILVVPRSGRKAFLQFALPALTNSAVSAATSAAIVR